MSEKTEEQMVQFKAIIKEAAHAFGAFYIGLQMIDPKKDNAEMIGKMLDASAEGLATTLIRAIHKLENL